MKSQGETTGCLINIVGAYSISARDLRKKPREGKTFTYDGIEIHETIIAYKDVM